MKKHIFSTHNSLKNAVKLSQKKTCVTSSDDQPWYTEKLKTLNKKKKQEYHKNQKSLKWRTLNQKYKKKVMKEKLSFYKKNIKKLRHTKPH